MAFYRRSIEITVSSKLLQEQDMSWSLATLFHSTRHPFLVWKSYNPLSLRNNFKTLPLKTSHQLTDYAKKQHNLLLEQHKFSDERTIAVLLRPTLCRLRIWKITGLPIMFNIFLFLCSPVKLYKYGATSNRSPKCHKLFNCNNLTPHILEDILSSFVFHNM